MSAKREEGTGGGEQQESKRACRRTDDMASAAASKDDSIILLGKEEEERLFKLWVTASRCEARFALDRRSQTAREDYYRSEDLYMRETDRMRKEQGLLYDPNRRAFVEYLDGLDIPTSKLWFQYRPVAARASLSSPPLPSLRRRLRRRYDLRILSHETRRNRSTIETLERYQIRRYSGVFPTKIGILGPRESTVLKCLPPDDDKSGAAVVVDGAQVCMYLWPPSAADDKDGKGEAPLPGLSFNKAAMQAMKDGCELLVLPTGESPCLDVSRDLDVFFPAYPVLLREALIVTPIQLLQINGSDPAAADVCHSLLDRISGILGAVIEPRGRADERAPPRKLHYDASAWSTAQGGLSSLLHDGGIESDPRCVRLRPGLASYIPTCTHGWLSIDTKIMLAVALEAYRPKTILELGSWYGLSSRFIMERAVTGCEFYTVDWFKNNAHYGRRMETITPLDKLYQRHLRYEAFCANMEPWIRKDDKACLTVRMDIHEAVDLFAKHGVKLDMVFIDAEKNTARLVGLLRRIMERWPSAVIVGDDYVFDSVKRAISELDMGPERVITRDESYLIVPQAEEGIAATTAAAAREAMARLEPELLLPPVHAEVCSLIERREYDQAARVAKEGGLGWDGDLYSPGKSTLHEICRQKDTKALEVLDRFCAAVAEGEKIPVNELGLTPFDYFTHKIDFS